MIAEQQTFLYFHSLSVSIFCPASHSIEHQVLVGLASVPKMWIGIESGPCTISVYLYEGSCTEVTHLLNEMGYSLQGNRKTLRRATATPTGMRSSATSTPK